MSAQFPLSGERRCVTELCMLFLKQHWIVNNAQVRDMQNKSYSTERLKLFSHIETFCNLHFCLSNLTLKRIHWCTGFKIYTMETDGVDKMQNDSWTTLIIWSDDAFWFCDIIIGKQNCFISFACVLSHEPGELCWAQ